VFAGNFDANIFNFWALVASVVIFIGSLFFSRWLKQREARRLDISGETTSQQRDA
jgi:uncharacterized membrane protein